jgi:hypothetical protein
MTSNKMTSNKIICYEDIHCKLNWKYKSLLKDDFEIINVIDVEREINYCSDSTQYIMSFISMLKHRVIRLLPDLNKVKISIGVFDKNNILHRLMVGAYYVICDILRKEVKRKSFYKSVFTVIEYDGGIVFMGELSFDGIK